MTFGEMRVIIGLLASTFAVMAAFTVWMYIEGWGEIEDYYLFMAIPGTFFVFMSLMIVGLPVHLMLSIRGKTSLSHYAIAGTLIGDLYVFGIVGLQNPGLLLLTDALTVLVFSAFGFIASVIFWIVAVKPLVVR